MALKSPRVVENSYTYLYDVEIYMLHVEVVSVNIFLRFVNIEIR